MDYLELRVRAFEVIGTGKIEVANKNVFTAKLRVSEARWGSGGQGKAMTRAMLAFINPVFDFNSIRLLAFPKPWSCHPN
jgi:hypothetical protein